MRGINREEAVSELSFLLSFTIRSSGLLCSLYELMSKADRSARKLSGITCGWRIGFCALERWIEVEKDRCL